MKTYYFLKQNMTKMRQTRTQNLENIDNNQFEQLEKAAAVVAEDKPASQKTKPQYIIKEQTRNNLHE